MPRVLMITARYAPDARIGTRRVLRLCRRLPARGWTPVVLHPDAQAANPTPPPIDDSLRAPPIEAHSVPAFFPSVRLQRLAERLLTDQPAALRVARVLIRDARVGDQFAEWTRAARRAALRLGPFDAVWATGGPFGLFVPAAAVAAALNAPLVLDYRDPWTPGRAPLNHPFGLPRAALRAIERRILARAAGVAFVNADMRARYEAAFGQPAGAHWAVIANGFAPEERPCAPPIVEPRPTLLYAGNCYASRSLVPVLDALAAGFGPGSTGLQLVVHGQIDPPAAAWLAQTPLPGRVHLRPPVSSDEIIRRMQGAAALLLLVGTRHATALTGKLFDYLLAERPILGVGPPGADAAAVIARCGVGTWADHEDRAGLIAALRAVETGLPCAPDAAQIAPFSADAMADATAALLSAAAAGPARPAPR
ncbi:MAG: glycosyltransferase [Myxococcales bacterium]|nr:glycosyltransferase [Myxococcales bacterium]